MHHALRSALLPALALGLASVLGGCKTHCDKNADGTETCTAETTVQYQGATLPVQQFDWASGQALRIGVNGGNVTFGELAGTAITVNVHGTVTAPAGCTDPNLICVQFTPINNDTKSNKANAEREMLLVENGGNLVATASRNAAGDVVIDVHTDATNGGKVSSSLSARVDVMIPAAFDGDLVAISANRKISVIGPRRGLDVRTENGDVYVEIPSDVVPAAPDDKFRRVYTGLGDITFRASSSANISVQAITNGTSSDVVTIDNVSGWQQQPGSTEQSATFCGNTACNGATDGNWYLETDLGNIEVSLR